MAYHGSRARAATVTAVALTVALTAAACVLPVGRSVEQREIPLHVAGSGPRSVLLIGGLHTGPEDNSRLLVERLAGWLKAHPGAVPPSVTVFIVPAANPDGSANGTHTNARGVDLNRNWPADNWVADACHPRSGCRRGLGGPAPLSEPETAALYRFIEGARPEVTIVWHAHAPLVEANEVPGADAYGRLFAGAAGYPYIEEWSAYRITGQLIDALEQRLGLRAFDVELTRCCVLDDGEFERNLRGVLAVIERIDQEHAARTPSIRTTTPVPTRTPARVPRSAP